MSNLKNNDRNIQQQEQDSRGEHKPRFSVGGCITWGIWLVLIVFFSQNAWASVYENETRAAMIYAGSALLLIFGGIIVYVSRRLDL